MSVIAVLPLLDRLDALIGKIDALIDALRGVPPEGVEGIVPPPQVTIERLNNRYMLFDIDTGTARTDVALGLTEVLKKQGVEHARYMVILALGGGFSYKLNAADQPTVDALLGAEWEFEVEEIFVTNAAVAGTARIHVEYRVE